MKPFRLYSLYALVLLLAAAWTTEATNVYLDVSAVYGSGALCTARADSTPPEFIKATKTSVAASDCTSPAVWDASVCSTSFTTTSCSVTDGDGSNIEEKAAALFGTNPFVIVQEYLTACTAVTDITTIKVYNADGKCHKSDTASYRASRNVAGLATVQLYTGTLCGTVDGAAKTGDSTVSTCIAASKMKVFGDNVTPFYLTSTKIHDSASGSCSFPVVPNQVVSAVDQFDTTCKSTSACTGTAFPFTSTLCSTVASYKADMASLFGTTPYLIVETYSASSCDNGVLTGIKTYWADGKCHKTTTGSYRAAKKVDGSAKMLFYSDAACANAATTGSPVDIPETAITTPACVASTSAYTKVYAFGLAPFYLLSTKTYESSTGSCKSPTVPNQVSTTTVEQFDTSCSTTNSCAAGASFPFTSTVCSTIASYKTDMASLFASNPYLIVEAYSANTCGGGVLTGIKTYWADGKCHKTTTGSYRAAKKVDGSAKMLFYSDAACANAATTGSPVDIPETAITTPACVASTSAYTKVYAFGLAPFYLLSTKTYESSTGSCKSPTVPNQVSTTTVEQFDTSCSTTNSCAAGASFPFTSTVCSTVASYEKDMASLFSLTPTLTVEAYSDASCTGSRLTGVTTYMADGKCHKATPTAGYRAMRKVDGSATINTYASSLSDTCAGSPTLVVTVTAAQATDNVCVSNNLVYGTGATPVYLTTTKTYKDDTSTICKPPTVPTGVVTTVSSLDTCVATSTTTSPFCVSGTVTSIVCSSLQNYKEDMVTAFVKDPFVSVQKFNPGMECAPTELASIATYVADGVCNVADTASYIATRKSDGAAKVITYSDSSCGTIDKTWSVTGAQSLTNSCKDDVDGLLNVKVLGNGITGTMLTSKVYYDTNVGGCKSPAVPMQIATTRTTSCSATTTCSGAGPYTGTYCSSILAYKNDVRSLFSSSPYVVVETYSEGACAAADIKSVSTYLADGKCHKTADKASYVSSRASDGSATITTFADSSSCGSENGEDVTISADQENTCVSNTISYGGGVTPLYLTLTKSYATKTTGCSAPGVPVQVVASVNTLDSCKPTSVCAADAEMYTSKQCSAVSSYMNAMAAVFGTNPYVIVEAYTPTKSCAAANLASVTVYLADGVCHATGADTSYQASRNADGSAVITPYSDGECGTVATPVITVSAKQATGNSCADGENGIDATKIYGAGVTPWFLTSTKTYANNTDNCRSPGVPVQVVTKVTNVDACVKTDKCSDAEPYTSTVCSSLSTYKADMSTAFGLSPYVVVKTYNPGKGCAVSALKSITAYLADGACHTTDTSVSYAATRASDGSVAVITYSDDKCATEDKVLTATTAQVTGNSCTDDGRGILDTRLSGSGATASVLSLQALYDTDKAHCTSPAVPTQVVTTIGTSSKCSTSSSCGAVFTGTSCSSILTLNTAMTALFGSNAFVTVEKYATDAECAADKLESRISYLADGKCHATGAASSYTAIRKSDGTVTVDLYEISATCGKVITTEAPSTSPPTTATTTAPTTATTTAPTTATTTAPTTATTTAPTDAPTDAPTAAPPLTITATPAQISTCANDMKVSSGGPFALKSKVSYDTGGCKGTPTQVLTELVDEACVATPSCATAVTSKTACGSTATHANDVASWYDTKPYVVVETYTGGNCASPALTGIRSYLADGKCHKTGTATGYRAARNTDGSVKIYTFATADCSDSQVLEELDAGCHNTKRVYGAGVTPLYFSTTSTYADSASTCKSPTVPVGVVTTIDNVGPCINTATTNGCIGSSPKTSLVCSSSLEDYQKDMVKSLVSTTSTVTPFMTVEKYNAGKKCDPDELAGVTTYIADASCHDLGSKSYKATRAGDQSATIITYTDSVCGTVDVVLTVTAAQAKGNSCAADGTGILDTKVSGNSKTTTVFSSKMVYDTCKSPVLPTQVTSTKVAAADCIPSSCSGSVVPYGGITCSSILTYKEDMGALFGSNPYVIVETYSTGTCTAAQFTGVITYLADGKCHQTATLASYQATRMSTGAVNVLTYTDAACATAATTLALTPAQAAGNSCADDTAGVANKKVYGSGATPSYLSLTMNYDSNDKTCKSGLPSLVTARGLTGSETCTPTTLCIGSAAPYTGTSCSSTLAYANDMAAVFGASPYVIVETYAAGSCTVLDGIKTYLADGKCHRTGKITSYIAKRLKDGSATIFPYAASSRCIGSPGATILVTAAQVTNKLCLSDTKASGNGVTPLYLSSTLYFDSANCKSPAVPIKVSTGVVAPDVCVSRSSCGGQATPFTSIKCGSTDTHATDLATIFGSSPYVVVETYTDEEECDPTKLEDITAYFADGKCHATETGSYSATRDLDGSATVTTYDDSTSCDTEGETLTVTAAQAKGNSCAAGTAGIPDTKVYGAGATSTLWSAVSVFDANSCKTPAHIALTSQYSCAAGNTCLDLGTRSMSYVCSSNYLTTASSVFGTLPYIVAEVYEVGGDSACGSKEGVIVYGADSSCHLAIDGLTSFTATLSSNGSGAIVLYEDNICQDIAPATLALTKDQLSSNQCVGSSKFSAFNQVSAPTTPPITPTPSPAVSTDAPASPTTPASTSVAPTPTTTTSTGSAQSGATSLTPPLVTVLALCGWVVSLLL